MGGAASMTSTVGSGDGRDRYFCHQCHRLFGVVGGLACPYCDSLFVEELSSTARGGPGDLFASRQGQLLTSDQSRRIMNATALLRLLEAQLRDELEFLQRMPTQTLAARKKEMTPIMRIKCRNIKCTLDQICSQPSCPICTNDFTVEGDAMRLPCSHLFHGSCVTPWLDMKQNCPICRQEITSEVMKVEEYQKYSIPELLERLVELNVDVADTDTKSSDDLGKLLHKRLEQMESDDHDHEVQAEQARLEAEQQRRALFERHFSGSHQSGNNERSSGGGPGPIGLMSVGGREGQFIMLDPSPARSSGPGLGSSGNSNPNHIMSFNEFYHHRQLQRRLEESTRASAVGGGLAPSGVTIRSDSDDDDLFAHLPAHLGGHAPLRRRSRPITGADDEADFPELRRFSARDLAADAAQPGAAAERLLELERIEREMADRHRLEREAADREDLAELNEWEAEQGLPLTHSFRTAGSHHLGGGGPHSSAASSSASSASARRGYAQAFVSRIADTAISTRLGSSSEDGLSPRSRLLQEEYDELMGPSGSSRTLGPLSQRRPVPVGGGGGPDSDDDL